MSDVGDPRLRFTEAATYLGCTERHVYRLDDELGEVAAEPAPTCHRGRRGRVIRRSELDRYIERSGRGTR